MFGDVRDAGNGYRGSYQVIGNLVHLGYGELRNGSGKHFAEPSLSYGPPGGRKVANP